MMNDETDPVEEIRAIRKSIARKYKTTDAYFAHLKTVPSAEVLLAQVQRKNEKTRDDRSRTSKPAMKPASRRGAAKRLVHA
jgi:hypothetical protein